MTSISLNHPASRKNDRFLTLLILICLVLNGSTTAMAQQASPPLIRIGTVSGQIDAETAFGPFTSYLESELPGYRFQVIGYPRIETLTRAVENEVLDFAFMSPAAYIGLTQEHRIIATITQQVGETFSPWLAGAVFTRASRSDINELGDVRGRSVVAMSEIALGGWLAAVREWRDVGIEPDSDFASLEYAYSFSVIGAAVCSGETDVGVMAANALPTYQSQCGETLKVLPLPRNDQDQGYPLPRSTRLYPEAAFVMTGSYDEEFIRQFTRALLSIEPDSAAAQAINIAGFTAPLLYTEVQSLLQELRLGPYQNLGEFTLKQILLDNFILVILVLVAVIALISIGFINAHRHSRRFRASERYRKLVFEGSHIPMVVVDPVKNVFIDMNQAAVRQYGYSNKEELTNKSLYDLTAPEQESGINIEEAFESKRQEVLETGTATFNWRHVRPDGEEWIARIHLMAFDSPTGKLIQATVEDISQQKIQEEERRHLEKQLAFSQRMESIGRLAGGIAHDFNNLLTIINGYCEVLMLEMTGSQSEKILEQIGKAGLRASELTQQLLTFSRRQAIRHIPVNVNRTISDSAEMIRSVLGEDIRLNLDLMNGSCHVLSDPGQMQQVILNLVVNAKDAMPDGGLLKIRTHEVFMTPRNTKGLDISPGDYIEITVSDTGVGMSPRIKQHIFEPFFTTKDDSGTGLGLSTVYGIVQQSLGSIQVYSREGEGSTFRILLPKSEEIEQSLDKEDRIQLPSASDAYRILVVEDQLEVLDYATSVLKKAGYQVLTATSGNEALAVMGQHDDAVHLLLTDVVMEGMSGGELAEQFSKLYPDIPVLFTSGYPGDELARYGVLQGTREFLAKPFSPKDLLARVNQILGSTPVLGHP